PDGLSYADRAIALDPKDAQGWETRGRILGSRGRVHEAREALARCTTVSLGTTDCFFWLSQLDAAAGRCDDAERDLRRGMDRDTTFVRFLGPMMLGAGRPIETVREAMRQAVAIYRPEDRREREIADALRLAIAGGDFAQAKKLASDLAGVV